MEGNILEMQYKCYKYKRLDKDLQGLQKTNNAKSLVCRLVAS